MRYWKRPIQTLTREQIDEAVDDAAWQHFRLSLKGTTTSDKLEQLDAYLEVGDQASQLELERRQVRVDNYINALLRGGQLRRICANIIIVAK